MSESSVCACLLSEMGLSRMSSVELYADNTGAIFLAGDSMRVFHSSISLHKGCAAKGSY